MSHLVVDDTKSVARLKCKDCKNNTYGIDFGFETDINNFDYIMEAEKQ